MNRKLDLIYKHTHADYRSIVDGKQCILVLRAGEGTCLVSLGGLTEQEIAEKLPYALKKEAEQMGRDAQARKVKAAPALDTNCMELIKDMNPSGAIGAVTTTVIMEAWSRGWHAANAAAPTLGRIRP